jgi:hypothetical protein
LIFRAISIGRDFLTPTETIVGYFPVPVVLLRTLKAEVISGLTSHTLAAVQSIPDWLVSGKFAVLQFIPPKEKRSQ